MTAPKTLIVGLGNPILGDDGVGWRIAEGVQALLEARPERYPPEQVQVVCLSLGGLSLMERLIGYERVILVDALGLGRDPVGTVQSFPLEALPDLTGGHLASAHDTTLQTAIAVGRSMGAELPRTVSVVAVEARAVYDFSEELSPPVAAAVPAGIQAVLQILDSREE
jgi:hydrogenase maturation protease